MTWIEVEKEGFEEDLNLVMETLCYYVRLNKDIPLTNRYRSIAEDFLSTTDWLPSQLSKAKKKEMDAQPTK